MGHRLRPRAEKKDFSGFSTTEIEKLETVVKESRGNSLNQEVFKKLTRGFNISRGHAGKPVLKWTEVEGWFLDKQREFLPKDDSLPSKLPVVSEACTSNCENGTSHTSKGDKVIDLSKLKFEAKSTDGAWYDVETFITHRFLSSGEPEVLVRYVGFGSDEDEWVQVKNVRERSLPLEHSECQKVMVGDLVLCFQEKKDQARHYDAHVIEIQRKLHDIRGCRCIFWIQYDHDNSMESVQLKRLCCRPEY